MARYEMKPAGYTVSLEKLALMIDAAQVELSALCQGKRFQMRVPVDDTDTDMVLGDALTHARALVSALLARESQPASTAVDPVAEKVTG